MKEKIRETAAQRSVQEERLAALSKKMKWITVYYAVFAAAFAVLSAVYEGASWRVLLTVMTVLASLAAVVQCADPFAGKLSLIRRDRAELERMENDLSSGQADEQAVSARLQAVVFTGVCSQDRRAFEWMQDRAEKAPASGEKKGGKRLFGYEKFLFWFFEIAGIAALTALFLLPAAGVALAACGLL